jgi:hypothetical protein
MDSESRADEHALRGRVGGTLALVSGLLVVAAFRWAHHWDALTGGIVAAWVLATFGALAVSIWSLRTSRAARRFAKIGIALTVVSILALTFVGLALAAGGGGGCGGG